MVNMLQGKRSWYRCRKRHRKGYRADVPGSGRKVAGLDLKDSAGPFRS